MVLVASKHLNVGGLLVATRIIKPFNVGGLLVATSNYNDEQILFLMKSLLPQLLVDQVPSGKPLEFCINIRAPM